MLTKNVKCFEYLCLPWLKSWSASVTCDLVVTKDAILQDPKIEEEDMRMRRESN